jgi:hypothetical protein
MCCETTKAQAGGSSKAPNTCMRAAGPPVEEPIAITRVRPPLWGSTRPTTVALAHLVHAELPGGVHLADQLLLDRRQLRGRSQRGLGHEVDGAELEGSEHGVAAAAAAHHQNRGRALRHQQAEEGEAVHARHLEVEGDQVRAELERLAQRLLAVAGPARDLHQRRGL